MGLVSIGYIIANYRSILCCLFCAEVLFNAKPGQTRLVCIAFGGLGYLHAGFNIAGALVEEVVDLKSF